MPLVAVTPSVLDLQALTQEVTRARAGDGAVASFIGLVRDHNQGRRVSFLDYEAYEPLAVRALGRIVGRGSRRHGRTRGLACTIGPAASRSARPASSSWRSSPHRANAFAACRYTIERIKQIVPIWKHEHFEGGDVWLEGATADPDDESARQAAYRIACA